MSENNAPRVIIAPSALADLEQTLSQEEIQELLNEFQRLVESGELLEQSTPIDMDTLEQDDPELFAQIQARMKDDGYTDMDSWLDSQHTPPTLN